MAANVDGKVYIAASKANEKHGDVFDKDIAKVLAARRIDAILREDRKVKIPASFGSELPTFIERCEKYFQDVPIHPYQVGTYKK